ncbi:hypothetical protein METBIDRAFT_43322 [Metschnikowia bicuspidata var. bicuspidata NRRL YB-4993]|uniref:SH3 domain-containing protein n=1 Tax=Metschnikowia bicuspidata var. bicuspidata NRRL YB-4993 TaxID=869754 RepID=A0A1A0H8H5_9ASCO|nr:hypothetical protein METBIDRAFT_43322 [Metschnikowia bicuspidata var. bicuspidata NRRL YB-4993]OBA20187.1 hypothetical protein METBIDRAFT_43322 [Metschnikowia bicuspidata var. bicuspidata NRRL YB-4993]
METPDPKKPRNTNRVFGSIADKIASTSNLVRDKTGKINSKVHEHWHKPVHVPTKTVDEEFEDLIEELDAIVEAFQEIIKLHKHYIFISTELVQSSQRVANSIQVLSSPATLEPSPKLSGGSKPSMCEKTRSYCATMVEIGICLRESLSSIPQEIDERIQRLLSYLEKIQERVALRDRALMSYDKVYDKFDGMTILSTTNEFTPKQKQEYFSLEKKLVELKKVYDQHNLLLKAELPSFFMFVRSFIEPMMLFIFYIQLTAAYQAQSNVGSVQQDFEEGGLDLLLPGDRDVKRLSAARGDCDDLHHNSNTGYCRALFDFCSIADLDLEFKKGDLIKLHSCEGEWWTGLLDDKEGIFPSVYVQRI